MRSRWVGGNLLEQADESQDTWIHLITDPVAIIYGCGRQEKEKQSGASNQLWKWVDRRWDRKRDTEHVLPCLFTQRLHSMPTLIPHFSLDQPTCLAPILILQMESWRESKSQVPVQSECFVPCRWHLRHSWWSTINHVDLALYGPFNDFHSIAISLQS